MAELGPPLWNGKTRVEVEQELMEVMEAARVEYQDLHRRYRNAMDLLQDIGLWHGDGVDTLRNMRGTHRQMMAARVRYDIALKEFNRVVVNRMKPRGMV